MHRPPPIVFSGFIAGFLAFIGAQSFLRLVATLRLRPLPTPLLAEAIVGAIALPVAIALLFSTPRSLLFARLYLGLNLFGQFTMVVICLLLGWYSQLPTLDAGAVTAFVLVCFYFTFLARETNAATVTHQ